MNNMKYEAHNNVSYAQDEKLSSSSITGTARVMCSALRVCTSVLCLFKILI